jgi:GTPase SAR1 family protein
VAISVCPFCFNKIDLSRLWYQCLGRGNGDCKKEMDPERHRLTKSTLETFRSFPPPVDGGVVGCPTCGGRTNLRACPQCHSALPANFDESRNPMLGLVGAKGSGKTVLMTVLVKHLHDQVGARFGADIMLATDNPDGLAGVSAYKAQREIPLFKEHTLPPPTEKVGTAARQASSPVLLRWRQEEPGFLGRTSIKSTMLSFVDTAGEDLNAVATTFTLQYLSVCDGLIVLLDPFALPGARAMVSLPAAAVSVDEDEPLQVVSNITEMLRIDHGLRTKQKISIPVAVVFTKIDAFFPVLDRYNPLMTTPPELPAYDNTDGQAVHEHMLALLNRWRAMGIDAHMRLNYKDFRYFGVSALGAEPDYEDLTVAPGGVRPHRVEDPVLWLLTKIGTLRAVRTA